LVECCIKGKIEEGKQYILEVDDAMPYELEEMVDQLKIAYPNNKFFIIVGGLKSIQIHDKDKFVKALKEAGII
jgi:hypothetical protein